MGTNIEKLAAMNSTRAWMDNMIHLHERGAEDLKRYKARFLEAAEGGEGSIAAAVKPVDVLSWFVNEVNNIRMNGRLDLAVINAARLATAEAMESAGSEKFALRSKSGV